MINPWIWGYQFLVNPSGDHATDEIGGPKEKPSPKRWGPLK